MIRSFNGATPKINPTAFVSEAAYVVGDVEIGAHSSIWPGVVIRGDVAKIRIGANTNIQDNSVVHTDAGADIGDCVTLGHAVVCHAAVVESNALLGNGCVVNEGARIGAGALVAAGSVVLERKEVPPGAVVAGTPAEVKGRLMARHKEMMERTWRHYVEMGRRFKEAGLEGPAAP